MTRWPSFLASATGSMPAMVIWPVSSTRPTFSGLVFSMMYMVSCSFWIWLPRWAWTPNFMPSSSRMRLPKRSQVIAAEAAREARHVEVIVHHRLALGRIVEGDAAASGTAGDGGELRPDFVHAVLQGFPAIGIINLALDLRALGIFPAIAVRPGLHRLGIARRRLITVRRGAERAAENLEIAEPDLAAFGDPDKGAAFPAAAGVGGVTNAELLLLG